MRNQTYHPRLIRDLSKEQVFVARVANSLSYFSVLQSALSHPSYELYLCRSEIYQIDPVKIN